jgi:ribose-phosphate pyrophosphokinase
MDRAIGPGQPFTLEVLAGILKAACAEANDIRILDPHSSVTLDLIPRSQAIHADSLVRKVLARMAGNPTIVIPDKGAIERTNSLLSRINAKNEVAQCSKVRDMATGKLSGFSLDKGDVNGKDCLIVDDICDGGWTFTGTAKVLREHGAKSVSLCVTHGIFSKGIDLDGVDMIYTTDSYYPWSSKEGDKFVGFENFLRDWVTGPK